MSTDLTTLSAAELEKFERLEAELAAENAANVDAADIQIPLLKIGQALTTEVADGDARPGEFINALTREGLGDEIEFVVAGYSKGRFDHGDRASGKRARKAYGNPTTVPWRDDPFYGSPFSEHPDAEETYSDRANNGDIEWGSGPRISTTYDFTGFVVADEGEEPIPVCLSLYRLNSRQAKKWVTLLDAVLRGRYWDSVFALSTERKSNDSGNFYVVNVKQGRKTTQEEKLRAVKLAQILRSQSVAVVGEEDDEKPAREPSAAGGMAV